MSSVYYEVAFVFGVTGAAYIWPPLALLVGMVFFLVLAVLHYAEDARAAAQPDTGPEVAK